MGIFASKVFQSRVGKGSYQPDWSAGGSLTPLDYTTNMVAKYQSGDDTDFTFSSADNIANWIEELGLDPTHKNIVFVGAGGYSTRAKHRNTVGIDGDKVVETVGAGEYRLPAIGKTTDFFSGSNASIVGIVQVKSIIAAFGTPDCILMGGGNEFALEAVAGPKLQFSGGAQGSTPAQKAVALNTWYIVRGTINNSDKKARITVGNNLEVAGAAGGSTFPANNVRWYVLANSGTGGRSNVCVHQFRVYNELLNNINWGKIKTYERALHGSIT